MDERDIRDQEEPDPLFTLPTSLEDIDELIDDWFTGDFGDRPKWRAFENELSRKKGENDGYRCK